ncbi:hypothetical protein ED312_08750 [Sinomicrobium pectinilyticum]|uniref:Uncharacterized protein YyaB-like PH domain-containing protein n=1 Tax=Sinomicrobium pectinilyticum TaxID=1084421 RepID=A0A3N0EKU8_SINP1|nr:PH domain-containing protein [Sinomicrobium pectinilyticum]RNL88526.1 hypothetical protein ED312_08750 [Sinomicrobium pectinilyticum]
MKFKSKKDKLFHFLILGSNAFLVGITVFVLITGEAEKHEYWELVLILGVVGLLFWMYFGTNYELSKDGLMYRCGPLKGKIGIDRIREIVKGKTLWVGFKPATSRNGLIVKYDKYNKIYISPETNESFIEKILELNSDIKITE